MSSHYELARENPSSKSLERSVSVVSKRSSKLTSCRICLSSIMDPAILTCGHIFCERCLEQYWDTRDRPDFIVCPLCRTFAFNVNFTKDKAPSKDDFRRTFNVLGDISETEKKNMLLYCLKLSIFGPLMYFAIKWLRIPILELLNFIQIRFSNHL